MFEDIVKDLRAHYATGVTRSYDYRMSQLKGVLRMVRERKSEFLQALSEDIGKHFGEGELCERGLVETEILDVMDGLYEWMHSSAVSTPLFLLPASAYNVKEPHGLVLVIAPFNYALNLALTPLVWAIATGNVAILKPSEIMPKTSAKLASLLPLYVESKAYRVVEGGKETVQGLLEHRFDFIFFTGSPRVGRIIHQAANKWLTPTCLELGGKSPCIVDETCYDLKLAARRIIWAKFTNAGQTCIAPDYLLLHKNIKEKFLSYCQSEVTQMFGEEPKKSEYFTRLVTPDATKRMEYIIDEAKKSKDLKIFFGGEVDVSNRYCAPTFITNVPMNDDSEFLMMKEEIFGPILPVLDYEDLNKVYDFINKKEYPLAIYIYSHSKKICDETLNRCSSGSACVNDSMLHFACSTIPFGGKGLSGLGSAHSTSLDTFSQQRGVLRRYDHVLGDIPLRYAPYTKGKVRLFGLLLSSLRGINLPPVRNLGFYLRKCCHISTWLNLAVYAFAIYGITQLKTKIQM